LFHVLIFSILILSILIFLFLCIYLFSIFFSEKNLVSLMCFIIIFFFKLYFCLIRCKFEVWKKKTNLIFLIKYGFFSLSFALYFVFLFFFGHLFSNFLLRLFDCISLFCFMFRYIYFIFFHIFLFLSVKKNSNC
jgi:hypothetical protein